jgi:hypothetical protein
MDCLLFLQRLLASIFIWIVVVQGLSHFRSGDDNLVVEVVIPLALSLCNNASRSVGYAIKQQRLIIYV